MRELDELLIRYLEVRYPIADDDEKATFQAVLELPDPDLNGYLLQRQTPSSESVSGVIKIILSLPHA
jgi:succinate dehydrogenase flavin-adding protein (antitoxin of CptAB toxin-antitoxin module)